MSRYVKKGLPPISVTQNLLTSQRTIRRLVDRTDLCANDHVIEIGCGKGHITRILAEVCGRVTAVEIDAGMCRKAAAKTAGFHNTRIVNQDFLKWGLPKVHAYKVFSNIPFSITTPIIDRLTGAANPPKDAWLVMEKAAARRFAGAPKESLRSLLLKPRYDVRVVCHIPRDEFHPRPSVDAALFHMRRKTMPDVSPGRWRAYERFVREGLKSAAGLCRRIFSNRQLSAATKRAGMDGLSASGEIKYVQWLCLFREYLASKTGR